MAVSPNIPTSFVPKQPVQAAPKRRRSGLDALFLVALIIFGSMLFASGLVFGYQLYLENVLSSRQALLSEAQERITASTVEQFIRTRNRFVVAEELLDEHIALSQFFRTLEGLTLQNVRFNSLTLSVLTDQTAELAMSGTARNFNALAAQSNALGNEPRIRRAIFSDIDLGENGVVTFSLTAELERGLIVVETPAAGSVPAPEQSPETPDTGGATTSPEIAPETAGPESSESLEETIPGETPIEGETPGPLESDSEPEPESDPESEPTL